MHLPRVCFCNLWQVFLVPTESSFPNFSFIISFCIFATDFKNQRHLLLLRRPRMGGNDFKTVQTL